MSNDLGIDRSGNNNSWTVNNITYSDQMVDSPTNNFATWNPLQPDRTTVAATRTFAEGNLKITTTGTSGADSRVFGTIGVSSGKWYFEWVMTVDSNTVGSAIGFADEDHSDEMAYYVDGTKRSDAPNASYGATWTIGDIIGIAFNADTNAITFYKNNATQGEITSAVDGSQEYFPFVWDGSGASVITGVANFGQDSSFAGAKTAQGNQDSGGIGDFYYTPPSGFKALCTSNLPAVAVVPSEHFNTVIYTGDGNSTHAITGVGFQPDFNWIKSRGDTNGHTLQDAVRGATATMYSQSTEGENPTRAYVASFDTDGFTTGNAAGASKGPSNQDGNTYVAWNWKANGSGSSNTNGSINTTATSANVDAGFSIVSYTGTGSAATIGHGLSKAPEMIIVKNRDNARNWRTYHEYSGASDPETDYLNLDETAAVADHISWNDTAPTSSVFSITSSSDRAVNYNGDTFVAYCFHSVDGYSKVGSYTGNGAASDGPFVYTGFRPKYVLIKGSSFADIWGIHDSERSGPNPVDDTLYAHNNSVESVNDSNVKIDILSNGFKARGNNDAVNKSGGTLVYIAFAETPFKYSNAR